MRSTSIQIVGSNFGRDFGWVIEHNGQDLARLGLIRNVEMSWDEYSVTPLGAESHAALYNAALWENGAFRFRNAKLERYAKHAFASDSYKAVCTGASSTLTMRGLYLLPETPWEQVAWKVTSTFKGFATWFRHKPD